MEEENDNEMPRVILYVSESKRVEDLRPSYIKTMLDFFPCNKYEWSLLHLQLLLNSLNGFAQSDKARVTKNQEDYVFSMKFTREDNENDYIRFSYQVTSGKIKVSASSHWMQTKLVYQEHKAYTNSGTRNRTTKQQVLRHLGVFYHPITLESESMMVILSKKKTSIFL